MSVRREVTAGLQFFVPGLPKPAGSKRAFIVRGQNAKPRVAVADASGAAGKHWRRDVQTAALEACRGYGEAHREPASWLSGGLRVEMDFWLPRPKAHYGKHGRKADTPMYPITRPDVLKLARAVEDALTQIVWMDDAQIVDEHLRKHYVDRGGPIGVAVNVSAA